MIVNLEESLYELEEAREDVLVLKSKITGETEYWIPTKEEDGVYLITYKEKHYKFSESTSHEPKHAAVKAIQALNRLKTPILLAKATRANQALFSLLASLEEPILANEVTQSGIPADQWLKLANEKGLWLALSEIPYDTSQSTRTEGAAALAQHKETYQKLRADFLKLADENDRPILDRMGHQLFDCILGECELESELDKLSSGIKNKLPGFRSEIEDLKRSLLRIT